MIATVLVGLAGLVTRAGGGQNFGGGGGGGGGVFVGGGGGTGSGGGGGLIFGIIFIGVFVVGFVAWRAATKNRKLTEDTAEHGSTTPFFPPGPAAASEPPNMWGEPASTATAGPGGTNSLEEGLAAIRAHDPAFDETRFIADAQRAFFTVQEAWTDLKPDMSRRVMADGIWQQHRVQIEQYQEQHRRNILENLAIANATIVGAHSDQSFDTITLRIHAGCADYDIDTDKNKIVRGNKQFSEWTEDWNFQRSSSATTKADGGTMAAKCPNCGAPLDLSLEGVCKYCKAPVMSGEYDWVLTRIDQVQNG